MQQSEQLPRRGVVFSRRISSEIGIDRNGAIGRADLTERQFDPSAVEDVRSVLAPATREEWMARFGGRDVCVEPCLRLDEIENG